MTGNRTLAAAMLTATLFAGCAMCRNPFDYCNAVEGPNGCPNCDFGARRGSMFAPQDGLAATTPLAPTPAQPVEQIETPMTSPSDVTGSGGRTSSFRR